ncbi:MAG: hypothetical protein ACOWWO_10100 [Peptococcaceae bacterium]
MKDKLFSGALAGLIGAGVVGLISQILKKLGVYDFTYMDIAASLILPQSLQKSISWQVVGWFNNFIIGVILGIVLTYILAYTGKDYGIIKGAVFGLVWWFLLSVVIQPGYFHWDRFHDIHHLISCIFRDVFFGIIVSSIIVRYADLKNPVK